MARGGGFAVVVVLAPAAARFRGRVVGARSVGGRFANEAVPHSWRAKGLGLLDADVWQG